MTQGAVEGKYETWNIEAKNNLSSLVAGTGAIHKAVSRQTGDFAADGKVSSGLLKYCGTSGQQVTIGIHGVMKATFAAAISSADMLLTITTSGYAKVADSGDWVTGRSIYTVTSGGVVAAMWNFINPVQLTAAP